MSDDIFIGEVHEVPYPFIREADDIFDGQWRPGCRGIEGWSGETESREADARGCMILRVVARFKPGRYTERTFYVRLWRDPDGREFGKPLLRIIASSAFKRLCRGYRHHYALAAHSIVPQDGGAS